MLNHLSERYSQFNFDILKEEYISFRKEVRSYKKETPYYVYALCDPNGEPFYVGKGKGLRAYQHFKNTKSNKLKIKHISILADEPFIVHIVEGNLTEKESYKKEIELISRLGRIVKNDGLLTNILEGGEIVNFNISSIAGKIGGKITKDLNLGIFSDSYDRSLETKNRWIKGVLSSENFNGYSHCSDAGKAAVAKKAGIHKENFDHSKTSKENWERMKENDPDKFESICEELRKRAKSGGERTKELGENFSNWDKEKQRQVAAKGGSVAGKIPMWTDGVVNKRSIESPGQNWFRGITKRVNGVIKVVKFKESM